MYNYDFKKDNETIINEKVNVNIKVNNNYYKTNFVLTEKNLLIFFDINKGNPIWGVGTAPLPQLYPLFNIPLSKMKKEIKEDNLYIITNDEEINCYDFDLDEFLNIKEK